MDNLTRWLEDLGLPAYAPRFISQGIDFALLSHLDDADLKTIGVEALGHRKRLLRAIEDLRHQAKGPAVSNVSPVTAATTVSERRQLTVMFCDLVGSTSLATRLDPEDFQDLLQAYHQAVTESVAQYGGHVAQFLGDGALVYFGFPTAYEDSDQASRDTHAGADRHQRDRPRQCRVGLVSQWRDAKSCSATPSQRILRRDLPIGPDTATAGPEFRSSTCRPPGVEGLRTSPSHLALDGGTKRCKPL